MAQSGCHLPLVDFDPGGGADDDLYFGHHPGLLAVRAGQFDFGRWLLLVVGLIFAHATNNLLNDHTDYKRGVDKDNYFRTQYGPQPLERA